MKKRASLLLLLLAAVGALAALATAEERIQILDPATGEIDGKTALAIYPVRYEGHRAVETLPSAGLEVHLVLVSDPDVELAYPCGEWFLAPPGTYRFWIEGDGVMSPYAGQVVYNARPFDGRGMPGAMPIGPAGRVVLPQGLHPASHLQLRLLHAGPHLAGDLRRRELSRRVATDQVGGVRMPVGPTIAALWDRRKERYVALSRPFEVRHRETVEAPLEVPENGSHVFAQVVRRQQEGRVGDADVTVQLVRAGSAAAPDVLVQTTTNLYAIWYDVPAGAVEVRAGSQADVIAPVRLELAPGVIERIVAKLAPRPALDIELDLPPSLLDQESMLEIRRLPDEEVVKRHPVPAGATLERVGELPRELLAVELRTALGSFSGKVDLSDGADGYVRLAPDHILVSGTVYEGDQPHPAELTFTSTRKSLLTVTTDGDGVYELAALEPLRSVSIALAGAAGEPFVEFFPATIAETTERDFHVPASRFTARVVDAATGEGIGGAAVVVRNRFWNPGDDTTAEPTMSVMQRVECDAEGVGRLPPARPGQLALTASAEGYSQMREPMVVAVEDLTDEGVEIALEPLGDTVALSLKLPSGEAADGASVLLVESLQSGGVLVENTVDATGTLSLPRHPVGSFLLARHPRAAFLVRPWQPREGEESVTWTLEAAGPPLAVRVTDPWGEQALHRAQLALWVDGWRLAGRVLAWLTSTRGAADTDGFWTAQNVPARPLSLLAWGNPAHSQGLAGAYDALATEVTPPWPQWVELRAAAE